MDLNYLNPLPVLVRIDDDLYELAPVSLRVIQWMDNFFTDGTVPGSQIVDRVLRDKDKGQIQYNMLAEVVVDLVYHLLIDPDIWPSICIFKKTITEAKGGSPRAISELYMAVTQAFYNANPINQTAPDGGPSPTEQATGQSQEDSASLPDWADIYTRFASEYSYTIEQFYSLTYRQIDAILKALNKRKQQEATFQASLANQRLEQAAAMTGPPAPQRSIFTPDEDATAMVETRKLFDELNSAHAEKING